MTSGQKTKPTKPYRTPAATQSIRIERAYAKAVRIAADAIMEVQHLRPEPVTELLDRLLRGEMLTPGEKALIKSAISPAKRNPGHPAGSGATHERRIVAYGIFRTFTCRLPTYRNQTSAHRFTKVDAIAEAMTRCGLKRVYTYEALAAEMRRQKPTVQQALADASKSADRLRALLWPGINAVGSFAKKLDENY